MHDLATDQFVSRYTKQITERRLREEKGKAEIAQWKAEQEAKKEKGEVA